MKYVLAILLPILYQLAVLAQDRPAGAVTGLIADEHGEPVPFATVALYREADSTLAVGGTSELSGSFSLAAKPGRYFLKVTFVSYRDKIVPAVRVANAPLALGTIVLQTRADVLKEVVIEGERPPMELQLDKRVFNVSQDLSNVGANASDILGNLPSVTVDVDGAVSLRGSGNVRILIDGRPSGLTSRDPDALRKLQGNLIERIEVITNPSSRYDAAGEVGIINIILKKDKRGGVNGTFVATAGNPYQLGASYSINYRKNNINLFSSYGIDDRNAPGFGSSYQRYSSADTSFVYAQYNDRERGGLAHNVMLGLDYYLTEKTSLTGSFLYNPSFGVNHSTNTYHDFDEAGTLTRNVVRTEREEEDESTIEGTLSFRKDFERKDKSLTADIKWYRGVDDEATRYAEGTPGGALTRQRGLNNADEDSWLVQLDYVHPFAKEGKVEAGVKTNTRTIRNLYSLETQQEDETWTPLAAFTNNLQYNEYIHAAYVMAGNVFGKLSAQGGLRGEYSDIKTELTETNETNPRTYFNLFPSAALSYKLKENNTLQLSYSYRINRPDFRDLLPFSDFRDSRQFFKGNPNLKPEYTNAFELGYLLEWADGSILSSVYHRHRTDVVQRIVSDVDEQGRTQIIPINLAEQNSYGAELNLSHAIDTWWKINTSANFYRAITEGTYEDQILSADTYTWTTRTTSKWTFFRKLDVQGSFNYRAPRVTTQGRDRSTYSVDLGTSYDILKGKGTVNASVRDLFNSRIRRSIVDNEGYYSTSKFQWQSRQLLVTFTYRLNRVKESDSDHTEEM
jgi:outer membrane receptor protein involved in Fe transport